MAVISDQTARGAKPRDRAGGRTRTRAGGLPPLLNAVSVGLGIAVWWALALAALKLPTPPEVVSQAITLIGNGTLGKDVLASLTRVLIGFALGTAAAIPVGFLMGRYAVARGLVEPWIQFFRTVPPLAIIPPAIALMGIGEAPKVDPKAYYTGDLFTAASSGSVAK